MRRLPKGAKLVTTRHRPDAVKHMAAATALNAWGTDEPGQATVVRLDFLVHLRPMAGPKACVSEQAVQHCCTLCSGNHRLNYDEGARSGAVGVAQPAIRVRSTASMCNRNGLISHSRRRSSFTLALSLSVAARHYLNLRAIPHAGLKRGMPRQYSKNALAQRNVFRNHIAHAMGAGSILVAAQDQRGCPGMLFIG